MNTGTCRICHLGLSNGAKSHYEVIVPLFKSENHFARLHSYLIDLGNRIPGGISVIFVVDGRYQDFDAVLQFSKQNLFSCKIIKLSKNFGVGPALHAALGQSDACVSTALGSDLQEPVELFEEFFHAIATGEFEIALGHRVLRKDPLAVRLPASIYWWINRKWIHPESPKGGLDVFAMSSVARKEFCLLRELNTNFTSQLLWIGFNAKWIDFVRTQRIDGKSTWTWKRKMKLFADSVYGYSAKPMSFLFWLGAVSFTVFSFISLMTLVGKISGAIQIPGYTMIILVILWGQSVLLFFLGIIGGYIVRTFENSTNRPNYVIERIIDL
jgi:glycosyltransferase involved in cell wall biosynthesis